MRPIRIPALNPELLDALEQLYRTTRDARVRTRAQMVLLAAERRMTAAEIAEIVRASEETVRRLISSVTWPKELRACATCRIRAPRAR
jgi:predicted transcriptional regulator